MKAPKLKISRDCEGSVSFPPEFLALDFIDRADLLRDWLFDLTQEYNKTLDGWFGVEPASEPEPAPSVQN